MGQTKRGGRNKPANPNHNLWNNNGTWFAHYTIYPTPLTKERVRRSLKTKCIEEARRRRDQLFHILVGTKTDMAVPATLLAAA